MVIGESWGTLGIPHCSPEATATLVTSFSMSSQAPNAGNLSCSRFPNRAMLLLNPQVCEILNSSTSVSYPTSTEKLSWSSAPRRDESPGLIQDIFLSPRALYAWLPSIGLKRCVLHASVEWNPIQPTHLTEGTQDASERRVGNPSGPSWPQLRRASLGTALTSKCLKTLVTQSADDFLKQEIKMSLSLFPWPQNEDKSKWNICYSQWTFPILTFSSGFETKGTSVFYKWLKIFFTGPYFRTETKKKNFF